MLDKTAIGFIIKFSGVCLFQWFQFSWAIWEWVSKSSNRKFTRCHLSFPQVHRLFTPSKSRRERENSPWCLSFILCFFAPAFASMEFFCEMTFTKFTEFIDNIFVKKESRNNSLLYKKQRWYHSAMKRQVTERVFKLAPIHASVIY